MKKMTNDEVKKAIEKRNKAVNIQGILLIIIVSIFILILIGKCIG